MKISGLLPIGSVVRLIGGKRGVIILGVCQKQQNENGTIWDYMGALYPQGYISRDKAVLFNGDQIERVYALGYQCDESIAFTDKAEKVLSSARNADGTGEGGEKE